MSPIRLLHLVGSSRGGGAVHVRDLALGLPATAFTVTVAMPEDGGNVTGADFTNYGSAFYRLDIAAGLSPTALLQLRQLLREKSIDILHCHGARAAFYGRLAAFTLGRRRPKVTYTIHGFAAPHYSFPRRTILLGIERVLAPLTDAVICVCEAERQAFLAIGPVPSERVHVVRNGIDVAPFRDVVVDRVAQRATLGVPPDVSLVTTISRLYHPRDFETLLRAFAMARAQSSDIHLLIAGDGPYRPQVKALISRLGLTRDVTLAGFRRDVPQILAVSEVFVLSSALWEGLPLTILEAMAVGLPVVASDVGGVGEAVVSMETGILVPAKDPKALSGALLRLLSDPQEARTMGHRGRNRVEEFFTLDRMAQETVAVYEGLVSQE